MTCKLDPSVIPYRFTLRGTLAVSSEGDAPKIEISADVKNLTTLLKDEELSGYIRAVCLINISDENNGTIRGTEVVDATDVSSGMVDFNIDLFETMSFNWWDSFTHIWCETYILVDTQQMSEDYNITIPEEYYNMKGKVTTTYIFQNPNQSDLVVDERKTTVKKATFEGASSESLCDTGFFLEDSDDGFEKPSIFKDNTLDKAKSITDKLGYN
tara:strand:- start:13 stop:651 length:639 start_codon:yes stop_codon:yes gene_type:complete